MFVSDEDAVDAIDALLDGGKPRQSFALAQAAVHEKSGALRLEQGDVARAARRQNGNPQADRFALNCNTNILQTNFQNDGISIPARQREKRD